MTERPEQRRLLDDFKKLLQEVARLDANAAAIYAAGIEKGTITTRDAMNATNLRQTTAGEILRRLSKRGFFRATVQEPGTRGGRGHAQKFTAESPRVALRNILDNIDRFRELLGPLDEHMEYTSAQGGSNEEMWQLSAETLEQHFAATVASCSLSVKIASNDCSWVAEDEILKALKSASARDIPITVRAAQISTQHAEKLGQCGVRVEVVKHRGQPFALIDDRVLYIPVRTGALKSEYSGLTTSNPYTVGNFLSQFDNLSTERRRTTE